MIEWLHMFFGMGFVVLSLEVWFWVLARLGLPLACYLDEK